MRCLVVEDDPDIQSDLKRSIEAAGFVVDVVSDGDAAWYAGEVEDYAVAANWSPASAPRRIRARVG